VNPDQDRGLGSLVQILDQPLIPWAPAHACYYTVQSRERRTMHVSYVLCLKSYVCSCVTDDALKVKKIVQSMDRGLDDSTTMTLHFKVFKLRYSSQLVFENVIKACRSSADCRPPVYSSTADLIAMITVIINLCPKGASVLVLKVKGQGQTSPNFNHF